MHLFNLENFQQRYKSQLQYILKGLFLFIYFYFFREYEKNKVLAFKIIMIINSNVAHITKPLLTFLTQFTIFTTLSYELFFQKIPSPHYTYRIFQNTDPNMRYFIRLYRLIDHVTFPYRTVTTVSRCSSTYSHETLY